MTCPTCGNPTSSSRSTCTFCGESLSGARPPKKKRSSGLPVRVVNIKEGMPTAEQARTRLRAEIETSRQKRLRVLKIIHGYGSTGKGGVLRSKLRQSLRKLEKQGQITGWLAGEEFHREGDAGRYFLARYPELERDEDYKRTNPGITLVGLA